jgi:hypothetical protein
MKESKWFFPVNDLEAANKAIKTAYQSAFALAAIQALIIGGLSIFSNPALAINLTDPIFLAAIGYVLYLKPSRFAAVCLFLYSILIAYVTFAARAGIETSGFGGKNIFLALLLIYAGYQGLVGTFKYHKYSETSLNPKAVIKITFITALYSVVSLFLIMVPMFIPQTEQYFMGMSDDTLGIIILIPPILAIFLSLLGFLPFTKKISFVTESKANGQ